MLVTTISTQRSGTKFFGSMLSTGTQIRTLGEVFNPDDDTAHQFKRFVHYQGYLALLSQSGVDSLDRYFESIHDATRIIHFDLMFNQLDIPCLGWNPFYERYIYAYLKSRNSAIILLKRDPWRSFISTLQVNRSGIAHYEERVSETHLPPLEVSISMYNLYRSYITNMREELARSFQNYEYFMEVEYEDLAATGHIPQNVAEMIASCASRHSIPFDIEKLQLGSSRYYPTPYSYENHIVID